jgi:hypothetical protein
MKTNGVAIAMVTPFSRVLLGVSGAAVGSGFRLKGLVKELKKADVTPNIPM